MLGGKEMIESVESAVPRACVGPRELSRVRSVAALLPDVFSSYYLECRLAAHERQVDLLACLPAPASVAGSYRLRAALDRPARGRAWRAVYDVIRRWADPATGWAASMPFLWLEFDDAGSRPLARQRPSLCVCVDPSYLSDGPPVTSSHARAAAERCVEQLADSRLPAVASLLTPAHRRCVAACLRALPSSGRVIHLSFMLARSPAPLKIYGSVARRDLFAYLRRLGWPGDLAALRSIMRTCCTPATVDDTVYFDLAIDGELSPYIALAFSQLQIDGNRPDAARRDALLDVLAARGLCDASKRTALAAWPGRARLSSTQVSRWLDAKVCLIPGRGVTAKAYLGFAPVRSVF